MTVSTTSLSLPEGGSATLTLPLPLTHAALARSEAALGSFLRTLRRDLVGPDAADAGAVEYASWSAPKH